MPNRDEAEREVAGGPDGPPGEPAGRRAGSGPHGVLTLVCIMCGNEKSYADQPPARVRCEKCGSAVFRNFFTPTEPDEATISHLEETTRSISYDGESPDTSADEVRDLNNP